MKPRYVHQYAPYTYRERDPKRRMGQLGLALVIGAGLALFYLLVKA